MDNLIGLMVAVGLSLLLNLGLRQAQQNANTRILEATVAQQQIQFNTAIQSYVQTYSTAVQAVATASTPAVITVPMLQSVSPSLLPSSFNAVNPYGQTWQAQALQPSSGTLQVMTFGTGGTALTDQIAARIGAIVGNVGGLIPLNNSGTYPAGAATAMGTAGGWQQSMTGYVGAAGGRSVSLLVFANGQLTSNYLYRNAVPGQPQVNDMNTNLGLNGNAITNASAIGTGTLTTTSTATIGGTASIAGNTTIGGSATISGNEAVSGALNVSGSIATPATVSSGYVQLNNVVGKGNGCSPNGLLAQDGSGATLYCQSGVWSAPSVGGLNTGTAGTACTPYTYCNRSYGSAICYSDEISGDGNSHWGVGTVYWSGSAYVFGNISSGIYCDGGLTWYN